MSSGDVSPKRSQAPKQVDYVENAVVAKDPGRRKLALERYAFLNCLCARYGFPYYTSLEFRCDVLFPIGRSDLVYVFLQNAYWPTEGKANDLIVCYRRKNGKNEFLYRVIFNVRAGRVRKVKNATCMLNLALSSTFLGDNHLEMPAKMPRYIMADITKKQDFVDYVWSVYMNTVVVSIYSDHLTDIAAGVHDDQPELGYDMNRDPTTGQALQNEEFFRKYGFPITNLEWAAILHRPNKGSVQKHQ